MDVHLDACTAINTMRIGCWGAVLALPMNHYFISGNVLMEISEGAQARLVKRTLATGLLQRVEVVEMPELRLYGHLKMRLDDGEAATLAIAANRGGLVASDEKRRFLKEAERFLGKSRVVTTVDLAIQAISYGTISLERLKYKVGLRIKLAEGRGEALLAGHLSALLSQIEARVSREATRP